MVSGKVKWFNNAKGYGFVLADGRDDEDLFAHFSAIQMDGYKTLKAGQAVCFDIIQGPKGLHAINIGAPSADVALTIEGQPQFGMGEKIGEFPLYIPSVSVTSIGNWILPSLA